MNRHQQKLAEIAAKYQAAPDATEAQKIELERQKEHAELLYLGSVKKLFSIEVLFYKGNEVKRFVLQNQTTPQVMAFREKVFYTGLMVAKDPNSWTVFPPASIREINIITQDKFFTT